MFRVTGLLGATTLAFCLCAGGASAGDLLYSQDFEHPAFYNNDSGGDFDIYADVNAHYANQPPGFTFGQAFTVETLRVGGSIAFGEGYKDPQAIAGQYVLGMLSDVQNDLLGLAFNVGDFKFLNVRADISPIDLDRQGGPFAAIGSQPVFRFSLYDNPTGLVGLGAGPALASFDATGLSSSARNVFNWTEALGGLDASGSTNGNVILRIDLLSGGYAALDNLRIAASDTPGDIPGVGAAPEPASWALMIAGFGLAGGALRRRRSHAAV
jgi:hypothetical protein